MNVTNLRRIALAGGLWAVLLVPVVGCQGTDFESLHNIDENQVYRNEIAAILNDEELTIFEKDAALEELGVDDPLLRQHMIDNPGLYT